MYLAESLIITCGTYMFTPVVRTTTTGSSVLLLFITRTHIYLSRVRRVHVRRHLVTPLKSEIKPTQVIDLNAEW